MSRVATHESPLSHAEPTRAIAYRRLFVELLWLSLPVMAEHVLHMIVGLTDTWLANHLPTGAAAATAAIGTIAYVTWFMGLMVAAIGTGSTAIIARAIGARHRSLANSVCGQSVSAGIVSGIVIGALVFMLAEPIVRLTGLGNEAQGYALTYLKLLALSMPFATVMFVANACLRGAGDTVTPAVVMMLVDLINAALSFALTYGWFGLPAMGFEGIAWGTVIAYIAGGVIQFAVLTKGRGGIRLHLHRLRPHWHTMRRVLRIGIPSGAEGLIAWLAQFSIVIIINLLDPTYRMAAAHVNAIRLESMSYLGGFAFATAAATMVGQSLGMRDPRRAKRAAYLSFAVGGGFMTGCGIAFILLAHYPAAWISADPEIAAQTARCLQITGFCQFGFAAAMIFGGAMRGAGDTTVVMMINLASVLLLRLAGVLIVTLWLGLGLTAIWIVLSTELLIRGVLMYARFLHGGWRHIQV
jgi:putative MATE family efflux protein